MLLITQSPEYRVLQIMSVYSFNIIAFSVFIPKIVWKEDCIQGSGGQRNMDCMIWEENKEKVINVVCLLKCEAKKFSAAEQAADTLREIRV